MNGPLFTSAVLRWFANHAQIQDQRVLPRDSTKRGNFAAPKSMGVELFSLLAVVLTGGVQAQNDAMVDLSKLEVRSLQMIYAGTPERAWRTANQIVEAKREELRRNLPALDETGRLKFLRRLRPYDVSASVGSGRAVAQAALLAKGVVLESILEDRRAARLLGREVKHLRAEEKTFTWRFLKITVDSVLEKLPANMALIELVRYRRFTKGGQVAEWYGAAILRRGKEPVFVPARRSAAEIDVAVRAYREAIEAVAGGVVNDIAVERGGRALHDWLVADWYPHLSGVQHLVICPDGALNFLPFGTLLDSDGKLVAEKGTIYYASSGRDLVAREPANVSAGPPVIFADPEFGGTDETGYTPTGSLTGLSSLQFGKLKGTRTEAEKVGHILRETGEATNYPLFRLGEDATEAALRSVHSPGILHLATHGFFLEEAEGGAMSLSGLALSEAQATVESYRRGEGPDPMADGILLAEEAGSLDLRATELVTLSACRTAVGRTEPGEGVMGLRRALVQAGARNVLMTLWDIADEPTGDFMEAFYRSYATSGNAPLALSDVQRKSLKRLRREEGLAVATYLAGAFILSAQATPKQDVALQQQEETARSKLAALEAERKAAAAMVREDAVRPPGEEREFAGIIFCWCPAGTFQMGSPVGEARREIDETLHDVTLTRGFWLAKYECTQAQWKAVMGRNPSHFKGDDLPVELVSWDSAQQYIAKLNGEDGPGNGLRFALPTEAQWEYGCRAGTTTAFSFGNVLDGSQANCNGNYPYGTNSKGPDLQKTSPVGSYGPNQWGLCDMHGNVNEWCEDWYGNDFYSPGQRDPKGPLVGSLPDTYRVANVDSLSPHRVRRGGAWRVIPMYCRSARRIGDGSRANRSNSLGFRLAVRAVNAEKSAMAAGPDQPDGRPDKNY
ncbi:MAG: CHAT domain-containing protein [Verrucomicrobiales bacterium]|nr:CHAT domain-containing protein [Verrucomicrobiales bacterium]